MDGGAAPSIFSACLTCWNQTAKYRSCIQGLQKYLDDLSSKRDSLTNLAEDVKIRVQTEERERHRKPKYEVRGWLVSVEKNNKKADDILRKGEEAMQKNCLGSLCPANCRSRYKLAMQAEEMKTAIAKQLEEGHNFADAALNSIGPSSAVGPQEPTVGMDLMFDKVSKWVEDETATSVGLFGVGGVGKTTLLKKIHNHFVRTNPNNHYPVLWVVVSQPANVEQIQKKIWKQLKFSDKEWEDTDKEERPLKMQNFLSGKNFMLFLDDLWESIDLPDIGIPHHHRPNNSKVIFTTRLEEVCSRMRVEKRMKVECLKPEEALELFRENVGEETWNAHPQIPQLAEIVVRECGYLPLALITTGRAMELKKQIRHWERAVQVLKTHPSEFKDMTEKVLSRLEFSYHALPDETHRKCFLYCSLFPEDFEIPKYDLMDLWIGEGFFDESFDNNIHDVRGCYEDVIDKLTTACLLEENLHVGLSKNGSFVSFKMHDLVREMALWIARKDGRRILLQQNQRTIGLNEFERWKDAKMISVMLQGTVINEIPTLSCLNLSTLILRNTNLERFPSGFFSSMPCLKVLDLNWNMRLGELPENIGQLTNLQYLNLLSTSIKKLPEEFKKLVNLRFLFLDCDVDLEDFLLSSIFQSLRVFYNAGLKIAELSDKHNRIKLLKLLQDMEVKKCEVSLSLWFASEVEQLWRYPGAQSCLRCLTLVICVDLTSIRLSESSVKSMKHLEVLCLNRCHDLEDISIGEEEVIKEDEVRDGSLKLQSCFQNLRRVVLLDCPELLDLTSLIYCAPNLDTLCLFECERITEVVRVDSVNSIFSCLTVLVLYNLPSLKSIYGRPLPFPSLKLLCVLGCNSLQKLPFCVDDGNRDRYNKLQMIEGEKEWWDRLEWDDPATQRLLAPKFHRLRFDM